MRLKLSNRSFNSYWRWLPLKKIRAGLRYYYGFLLSRQKEGAIKAAEEGLQQSDSTPWKTRFESLISDLKADKEVFN